MKFYLGSHHATQRWWDLQIPLFVSRRVLEKRKNFPQSRVSWALDSGGFTELSTYGAWQITEIEYVRLVRRFQEFLPGLDWVAPMDWMCESFILEKTGLTVQDHQIRTVENFLRLREELGDLVIPVLQGYTIGEYLDCADLYMDMGVDLPAEERVGLGSICRRQDSTEAGFIIRRLQAQGLAMHGFGIKVTGLWSYGDLLTSADSMAWSIDARWKRNHGEPAMIGCTHSSCANCPRYAARWYRENVLTVFDQLRLEVSA